MWNLLDYVHDGQGIGGFIPGYLLQNIRTGFGAYVVYYSAGTGDLF